MDVMDKTTLVADGNFRELFLKLPIGRMLVSVGPDDRYAYAEVNAAAAGYFDLPREKMLGRTPGELFESALAEQMERSFRSCIKAEKRSIAETVFFLILGFRSYFSYSAVNPSLSLKNAS